jgi:hypothetical protein
MMSTFDGRAERRPDHQTLKLPTIKRVSFKETPDVGSQ